jgi:hypothetical protein
MSFEHSLQALPCILLVAFADQIQSCVCQLCQWHITEIWYLHNKLALASEQHILHVVGDHPLTNVSTTLEWYREYQYFTVLSHEPVWRQFNSLIKVQVLTGASCCAKVVRKLWLIYDCPILAQFVVNGRCAVTKFWLCGRFLPKTRWIRPEHAVSVEWMWV